MSPVKSANIIRFVCKFYRMLEFMGTSDKMPWADHKLRAMCVHRYITVHTTEIGSGVVGLDGCSCAGSSCAGVTITRKKTETLFMKYTFACLFALKVKWRKDGKTLVVSERHRVASGGSLYIKKVIAQDAGRYECSIRNNFGRATASALITVK